MDLSILYNQILEQDGWEWAGLISGILYVIFASRQQSICWIFGIISSLCIAWKSFTDYQLMSDGILQVFYILIGFYGLQQWWSGRVDQHPRPVTVSPVKFHLVLIAICLVVSFPASWLLIHYAHARYGYLDTALTLLSIFSTFLLVRKDLHNWIYWIIIDIVYVGLYVKSNGLLFAILFLMYTIVSIWGYRQWKKNFILSQPES